MLRPLPRLRISRTRCIRRCRLAITRSPTPDVHLHVIGVAAEAVAVAVAVAPALQFLVHVVQQDISQQRAERPALGHALSAWLRQAVLEHAGFQITTNQVQHPLVAEAARDPGHK